MFKNAFQMVQEFAQRHSHRLEPPVETGAGPFECKLALLNSVTDSTVIAMGGCRPSSFQCHFDPTPVRSFST